MLFGKHTDKLEADRARGVNTLPVILGEKRSRQCVLAMIGAQYLLCILLVLAGSFSWALLLVLVSARSWPRLQAVFSQPKPERPPAEYPDDIWPLWFSAHAFRHTRQFTTLFLTGVVLDTLLH